VANNASLVLKRPHGEQALIPAPLQLASDQAIVGIDGLVLSASAGGLVARLLQSQFEVTQLLGLLVTAGLHSCKRRLDTKRLQTRDDFRTDRAIHAQAAK
jgi:hypothetical protein